MKNIYHRLLLLIAGSTQKELARQVRYLKVENEILRSKLPKRVPLSEKEKNRLVRFGAKLGKALQELTTIVHPATLRRWIREARSDQRKPVKKGRPPTKEEIRQLILKLARENDGWGYTRIMGEMKKLGVRPPSRNTVKRILRENGFDPAPKRGETTWDEFLKLHADTLWQCDFLSVRSLTSRGMQQLFVLVFLHVGTRRIVVSSSTANPDAAWAKEQAEAFLAQLPNEQKTGSMCSTTATRNSRPSSTKPCAPQAAKC